MLNMSKNVENFIVSKTDQNEMKRQRMSKKRKKNMHNAPNPEIWGNLVEIHRSLVPVLLTSIQPACIAQDQRNDTLIPETNCRCRKLNIQMGLFFGVDTNEPHEKHGKVIDLLIDCLLSLRDKKIFRSQNRENRSPFLR